MSFEMNWQEPPAPKSGGRSRGRWDHVYEQLRENPGKWALVAENSLSGIAASLRARDTEKRIEFRYLTDGKGYEKSRCDIYARWRSNA